MPRRGPSPRAAAACTQRSWALRWGACTDPGAPMDLGAPAPRGAAATQRCAGGAELPGLSSLQLMGLPLTQQSSLALAFPRNPLSLPARTQDLPALLPTPLPQPRTQVLGSLLAPLLRLLVPRLRFLGICSGEAPSEQCPWGASITTAPLTPPAPTLLGPGAGGTCWQGCSRGGAVAPGGHILRGPGCATHGGLGFRGGPFTFSRGRGFAPMGQGLCWARGSSSRADGDCLAGSGG